MLIEYVPFGDLLGYLRKSRGLNDTYYKDPDIKPKTNLTSQRLMKFAWQIADGMSYLSSKRVCDVLIYCFIVLSLICLFRDFNGLFGDVHVITESASLQWFPQYHPTTL